MALEAAKGMLYLHSRVDVVLHRDLKSANLLVDKHWRVKVADFNLSRVMHASTVVSSVSATNPRYTLHDCTRAKTVSFTCYQVHCYFVHVSPRARSALHDGNHSLCNLLSHRLHKS